MKKAVFLLAAIGLILASCTKVCISCKNECYQCSNPSKVTCSTDFSTVKGWENVRASIVSSPNCTLIESSKKEEVCGKGKDDVIYLYENNNFYCD